MDRPSRCRERERDRGKAIFLAYTRGEGKFDEFIAGCSRNIIYDHSYEMNCNCRYYLQGTR